MIAAILRSRFNGHSISEICAMGGITLDDFTNSVAYKEIFGRGLEEGQQQGPEEGRLEGLQEGRQAEAAAMALRQLKFRCGSLTQDQQTRIQTMPLADLEALADVLWVGQGAADCAAWLAQCHGMTVVGRLVLQLGAWIIRRGGNESCR